MSEIYIVAGPVFSGVSLTAGIVHHLGVPAAPTGALIDDPADRWASHRRFFDLDFDRFAVRRLPLLSRPTPGWTPDAAASAEISAMLATRIGQPQFCIAGVYSHLAAPLLAGMGLDVRLIVCDRALAECQAKYSQMATEMQGDKDAWVSDLRDGIESVWNSWPDVKRLRVLYSDLRANTAATITALATFVDRAVTTEATALASGWNWGAD
jgi:hypothetical protein